MLFRSYAWKEIAMKKITGIVLMLCVVLTAAGCNGNTDKTDEITAFYEVNMLEGFDMDKELAKELISSGAEGFNTLVSTLDTYIRRADDVVLSILYDSYYYNGMNDGNRSFWAYGCEPYYVKNADRPEQYVF